MAELTEKTRFEPDSETDPVEKNNQLSILLQGPWNGLEIVRIERIEIKDSGWRVVFRE